MSERLLANKMRHGARVILRSGGPQTHEGRINRLYRPLMALECMRTHLHGDLADWDEELDDEGVVDEGGLVCERCFRDADLPRRWGLLDPSGDSPAFEHVTAWGGLLATRETARAS